jgi:xanthine dehydrogenase YagS FAD-binding subunit
LLAPGEFITEIRVPVAARTRQSLYLKIRDRESYEFALTSAAASLDLDGDKVRDVGLAVGGVGTKPWRLTQIEESLRGERLDRERIVSSAKLVEIGAQPLKQNAFKIDLVRQTVVRALMTLGGLA